MHNSQNKKTLQIVLVVLIAVLSLGIGYATISNINLIIDGNATANPNDNNFKVHFVETADTPNLEGNVTLTGSADIDKNDNTMATFNVGGLTKEGDYAIATYTIINNSNDVGAKLSLELTNSNADYFKVTETITDTELQAGDTTTGTVKVEMIKTPLTNEVTTSITAKIKASAIENASATGESPASKVAGEPESFSTDSWATIQKAVQNNNTSAYNVGDTKTVTINGNNYMVRIANKSTAQNCGNSDYSQTACGFVVEFADIITTMKMRDTSTNVGGYPTTLVFDYLNNTLLGQLPNDLQSVIEPTRVISGYGTSDSANFISTSQKLYLLSGVEVHGADEYDTAASTTTQLDYYVDMSSEAYDPCGGCGATAYKYPRAVKQYNGTNNFWWLRPAYSGNDYYFRYVADNGSLGAYYANSTNGVSPAFRIA